MSTIQDATPRPGAGSAASSARVPTGTPAVTTTLGNLLVRSAERTPDAEALSFPETRLTYGDLVKRSWSVARSLSGLGVRPRDHVGILMTNCPEFVTALFGIAMLGAVVVPINARYQSAEISYLAQDADLVAILTNDFTDEYVDFLELLREALPGLSEADQPTALDLACAPSLRSVVVLGTKRERGSVDQPRFEALADAADQIQLERWFRGVPVRQPAAIVYTSGTTSNPRGAILTHEALVRSWMMVGRRWEITAEDRFWDPCPLFHIAGLGPLVYTIGHGATFVTDRHFRADDALAQIEREKATLLYPTYPPITQALLNLARFAEADLSAVRAWLNVAPPETLRAMQARIPGAVQISTYGSTEGGPVTLHRLDDEHEARMTTCGSPLPGNELRIIDPATGRDLPPGMPGEIIYRGYNVFSGYYKDPEKTAASIDVDGWMHSGDRGTCDEAGRVTFLGRIKEMLKVGGENVAPAEVEEYVGTHAGVKLVQVAGIPDERLVEVPVAFVELHSGHAVSEAELIEFCRGKIASYKVPRHVRFVTEWPMSATKIQRFKLRDELVRELKLED